ncbi:DNA gyrase subunit A [Bellilinea caldifistulae]|uniref:DNA gyrase/topoisomerase IV subunit A n=1 Tax=Bellilinea caldifistulae TaxID=360411 RepID=UPI0007846D5C|nr:DNA topoisomerase (ATP-hydrolyzing) [Bellilinea caldifistulae]GAP10526.1 DNA gyrase subunit A [Bellilinea caldifistulae]
MEIGLVRKVDIDLEMQQSYLDYAMSVIVARALPDARDGLKPVQRRILYGMYDMGLRADSAFKKSARIVGEVLGKYHPHGDQAVYEAMARMAQDFTMRYPLIDGQGNFGSIDGDPPAAMRYTEARLTPIALDLLLQLDRDTVDFERNFDDSLNEPLVLPAALPNLLINGASGIAVGMATSIPPHNLGEVIDALIYMLERWERLEDIGVDDLMKFVRGPDFPTGGIILQENGGEDLLSAYATGRGKVTLRGKVQLEDMGRGKSRIIITELPYQINKASLIERIAELARENELEGISDLRDESDRQGMRIVIELNKVAEEQNVLRELYRRTPLQSTFRISLLALVDGEPRLLSLKQALRVYLDHRITVVRRRSEHDLEKARQRAHILEGLRVALANLDELINLIRKAQDVEDARAKLMKRYKLSEIQANAILEMQLRRLAALERKKIELEYQETLKLIKSLTELLRSPKKLREAVAEELVSIKQKYADRRRTQIVSLKQGAAARDILTTSELMPEEKVWVGMTQEGLIGRMTAEKLTRFSGKDAPALLLLSGSNHTLYLAAKDGRCAAIAVQSLPDVENFADGIPVFKACPLGSETLPVVLFSSPMRIPSDKDYFVVTISRNGMVKKTDLRELPGPSAQTFTLVKINSGDELLNVLITAGNDEIVLVSKGGMMIRFAEGEVRPMGLVAAGVNGIKLSNGDEVVGGMIFNKEEDMLLVSEDGKGWRMPATQTVLQGRYGQGIIAARLGKGTGLVGGISGPAELNILIYFEHLAAKSIRLDSIPAGKRAASGKPLFDLKPGERVRNVLPIVQKLGKWEAEGQEKTPKRPRRVTEKGAGSVKPGSETPKQPAKGSRKTAQPKQGELPMETPSVGSKPVRRSRKTTLTSSEPDKKASSQSSTTRGRSKRQSTQAEQVQPTAKRRGRKPTEKSS